MVYIQQNTPPPNKILTFSLVNFVGGLNNRADVLDNNQCSDVLNMAFTNDDVMEKRKGSTNFDELVLDGEVTFIDEFKPYQEADIMIRATKSEIYVGNTKIKDLVGQVCGVNFGGKYYFADGSGIYVYGRFPQEGGIYTKIVGEPTENYVLMELVSPGDYTALDNEHVRGVSAYDYTERKVWYEPCTNEVEDTFKQGNVVPTNPRFMTVHKGRLFVSGDDKDNDNVMISDVNNGLYFPASLPMQLPPNSDRVVGLHVYDDAVVVGRRQDVFSITGSTNRTDVGLPVFRLEKLNTHTGFANNYAVSLAHNYLFFLGSDGNAYALSNVNGNNKVLSTTIITRNVDMFKKPINLEKDDIYEASSVFFEDHWYLTMKGKVLVYSYRHQAWTVYDSLNARSFYKFYNVLIWGDSSGRTSMPSEDYLDYGEPYRAHWTSKQFNMDDANAQKQFREFFMVAHTFNEYLSDIYMKFEIDYVDVKESIVISNQIAIWGVSRFGDRFITRNINASVPFVIGRRGRNMRFTISNGFYKQGEVETGDDLKHFIEPKFDQMVLVKDTHTYYVLENNSWRELNERDLNQPMRVYEVNGEYEFRGKR